MKPTGRIGTYRLMAVTHGDHVHHIPEMWMVGATHGGKRTVLEAVAIWCEQGSMALEGEGDEV